MGCSVEVWSLCFGGVESLATALWVRWAWSLPVPLNGPGRGRPWKQAPTAVHVLFLLKTGPLR